MDLSKPSIYEGLHALEEKGFIILTNPRPATYQAIPPDIALDMRLSAQMKAKDIALGSIAKLQSETTAEESHTDLWYIFGQKHFESKIKEMLRNARKSIYCVTSGRFMDLIEKWTRSKMDIDLVIISDDTIEREKIDSLARKSRLRVQRVKKCDLVKMASDQGDRDRSKSGPSTDVPIDVHDYDNLFLLIVDESEMLIIPPISEMSSNAITMKNRTLVSRMKPMITGQFNDLKKWSIDR